MKPNNRTGSHNLPTLQTMLSERDRRILELVRAHRLLTTRQLQRLLFHDHATVEAGTRACNRVLTRLRERRFLERLDRPVGGIRGGSGSYVWMLGPAGDRITRPVDRRGVRTREIDPGPLFLAHTLAISETRVLLEEAARTGAFEIVALATEPTNWRTHLGREGTKQILKPDLEVVTTLGDYEDHWFFEIDQGTESIPTLIRKCLAYERYRALGTEQAAHGVFPFVVWIIAEPRRRVALEAVITADQHLEARLFRIVDPEGLIPLVAAAPLDLGNESALEMGEDNSATADRSKHLDLPGEESYLQEAIGETAP